MVKGGLIVNGQNNSIARVGGAGRYAERLHSYLQLLHVKTDLSELEIFLINFAQDYAADLRTLYNMEAFIAQANKIAQRLFPPFSLDVLSQIRKLIRRKVEPPNKAKTIDEAAAAFCKLNISKVVWHELSNYSHSIHLGRACLSQKLFLAVTFLDIQDFYYPEYFSDGILMRRRLAYSFYKERAQVFFAISEFTKSTMVNRLGIDPLKIKVIHLAANDMAPLALPGDIGASAKFEDTKKVVSNFGRYWIYPAKLWKHKNHVLLIRSIGRRKEMFRKHGVKFILTGGFDKNDWTQLWNMIRENEVDNIVVPLGFQSDRNLQALYRYAELMFFPSLFEGFGMPILEAMALGCPVACSDAGALKEIGGSAAVYFDASSEDSIVSFIEHLLEGRVDLQNLVLRGKENIRRFNWEDTCRKTIAEYKAFY